MWNCLLLFIVIGSDHVSQGGNGHLSEPVCLVTGAIKLLGSM